MSEDRCDGENKVRDKKKQAVRKLDMYPESWTHIYELGGTHGCYPVLYRWHPFCFCLNGTIEKSL